MIRLEQMYMGNGQYAQVWAIIDYHGHTYYRHTYAQAVALANRMEIE